MIAIGLLFVRMLCDCFCFKAQQQLEAEILIPRVCHASQTVAGWHYLRWDDPSVITGNRDRLQETITASGCGAAMATALTLNTSNAEKLSIG